MTRTQVSSSCTRYVIAFLLGIGLLSALMRLTGDESGWARAGVAVCYYSDPMLVSSFPIPSSEYSSLSGTGFGNGSVPVTLQSMHLTSPLDTVLIAPLPAAGTAALITSSFNVFANFVVGPGSDPFVIDSFFDTTFRVTGSGGGGGGSFVPEGTWPIEVLEMNLSGSDPMLGSLMLRESPTIASLGEHALHPMPGTPDMPGGMLQIDSFFDVFFELSLDGGQTWSPADSPVRLSITYVLPEPTTAALTLLGAAACGIAFRRKRS